MTTSTLDFAGTMLNIEKVELEKATSKVTAIFRDDLIAKQTGTIGTYRAKGVFD